MYTNAQVNALIAEFRAELAALKAAPAPVKSAPVVGTAEAPLYVPDRTTCDRADHPGCTRQFKSRDAVGFIQHTPCAGGCDNRKHRHA